MRRQLVIILACCALLAAVCLPAVAQYSIYGSDIYLGSGVYAPSWSRVGTSTFSPSNQTDTGSTSPSGKVLRAIDSATGNSGYIRSLASDNGIAFLNADVTAIVRCRTTGEAGTSWQTGEGAQVFGVCYVVGKGAFIGILPNRVGFYNSSGALNASLETNPATTPMDNSAFHTYHLVCRNATSTGVDVELYRDGRLVLAGRPNTSIVSALKVAGAYVDEVFLGSGNSDAFTGAWRFDRVAYRTGSYIPYGATDAVGAPITTGTVWDPWAAGTVTGTVTDLATSLPVANAFVETDKGVGVYTAADGSYTLAVPAVGTTHNINVSAAGYARKTIPAVSVPDVTPVVCNISLSVVTTDVSGVVTIVGTSTPIVGATVSVGGSMGTTDANGHYALFAPPGTHNVTVSAVGYVPKSLAQVTINPATDPVVINANLGLIGTPTRVVSDEFDNYPTETGTPPWLFTSPDGYTGLQFGCYDGFLDLYPEDPGHGLSLGGGFLPANIDCSTTFTVAIDGGGVVGITYRQPSPCTFDDLHGQTGSPGYFVRCSGNGTVSLWRAGTELASVPGSITQWEKAHQLRVIAYGTRHWVLLDGMKIIELTDAGQVNGGYVGICRTAVEAYVTSFSAAQLPDGGTSGSIATLTGIITDSVTGAPLAQAVVKASDGKFWETGADGRYTADLATLDDHSVTAYSPGHASKVLAINSPHTGANTVDVALTPTSTTVKEAILAARSAETSVVDRVVTMGNDPDANFSRYLFYIQDDETGGRGMRVRWSNDSRLVHEGDRVSIVGTLVHASDNGAVTNHAGEREILPIYMWVSPAHDPVPAPVYVRNSDVGGGFFGPNESVSGGPEPIIKGVYPISKYGNPENGDLGSYSLFAASAVSPLNNVGTLVRVCGKVTRLCHTDEPTIWDIYVDDGSLPYDGWLQATLGIGNDNHPAGVRLRVISAAIGDALPEIQVGDEVSATGIVGSISSSNLNTSSGTRSIRLIRVRKASDVQKLAP